MATGERSDVATLVDRTAALLRSEGRTAAADGIAAQHAGERRPLPSVLVAGEDKRGKSTLVNALMGEKDLSPVGVEVVTGAPLSMHHAAAREASVLRYGESTPIPTGFDEARRLATVEGNPQNEANIRMVQLGLPHPLLERVFLVDTPGVGGLNSGHGELTLQSLSMADALVFVLEAGAQFRAAELQFLRRASARIDTVILVLTKIDRHRGWRAILDDNLGILREQAPRFASCPVVPVSSVLALQALDCDDPEDAGAMREESGLDRLEALLATEVVDRAGVLADANQLRALLPPLAQADRALEEQLAGAAPDGAARQALQDEQARLRQFNSERADWQRRLDTGIRKITLQRTEDVNIGIVEVRRRYEERLHEPSKADVESMPGELVADLTALAGRLNEDSSRRLAELMAAMLDDVDAISSLRGSLERLTTDRLADQLAGYDLANVSLTRYEKLNVISSFAAGRSIAGLATGGGIGLSAGAIVAPPIGIAIGLGLGAVFAYQAFRSRKRAQFSSEFRQWMTAQCTQTQTTVNTTFAREVIDVQEEMRTLIRDALQAREQEINQSLAESKRLLETEAGERAAAANKLRERRKAIRGLHQEVSAALQARRAPAT